MSKLRGELSVKTNLECNHSSTEIPVYVEYVIDCDTKRLESAIFYYKLEPVFSQYPPLRTREDDVRLAINREAMQALTLALRSLNIYLVSEN